jgi:phytoene synthase
VNESPVTESPVTESPVTESPVTENRVTENRVTESPVTGSRVTESPATAAERQAAGSSFYAGMRILPKTERDAMFAVYGFCRAVDDIADEGAASPSSRREALDGWRRDLGALYAGGDPGRADFLAEPAQRFDLRQEDFLAVVDGMQMDVDETIRGPTLEVLDLYCDRVASAVGRLSVQIFGMTRETGLPLAHHLGRALQLTNILRDLDEDAAIGRLYVAREWLEAAGLAAGDPAGAVADPRIDAAAQPAALLAKTHYAAADRILRTRPKGRLAAPRLMSAVYGTYLQRMQADGWAPPRRRVSLSKPALAWVLLTRGLLGL